MAHLPRVSDAIQAALNDIQLLKDLDQAPDKATANDLLERYWNSPDKPRLEERELEEFWKSLKHGMMTMDVRTLIHYYQCLMPVPKDRNERGRPQEWTP